MLFFGRVSLIDKHPFLSGDATLSVLSRLWRMEEHWMPLATTVYVFWESLSILKTLICGMAFPPVLGNSVAERWLLNLYNFCLWCFFSQGKLPARITVPLSVISQPVKGKSVMTTPIIKGNLGAKWVTQGDSVQSSGLHLCMMSNYCRSQLD